MKKFYILILLFGLFTGFLCSCEDDDNDKSTLIAPEISIESADGFFAMPRQDTLVFKAKFTDRSETTLSWTMNGKEVSKDSIFYFTTDVVGKYDLGLTATNAAGTNFTNKSIGVYEKYKHGTFILSEGLIGTHGSLVYISPRGKLIDSVYYRENGNFLGDLAQDLFIYNNKMYIVAQIGKANIHKWGSVTVLNAETMKVEKIYQEEFKDTKLLNQPTHIAVLGEDDIYLRDGKAIRLFHPSSGQLITIEGSQGVHKNTMAVVDGKLFAAIKRKKSVVVIEKGQTAVSTTITFDKDVSGLIKSSDGKLWVSDESGKISKLDPTTYKILAQNQLYGEAADRLKINPASSQAASPHITAKGDTLYMSATKTLIYRHIFSQNKTKLMVDAMGYIPADLDYFIGSPFTVYNTCAVHPITGEVIINTLKGWGNARFINHITLFDFNGNDPRVSHDYANYMDYPANVYFTYNFD